MCKHTPLSVAAASDVERPHRIECNSSCTEEESKIQCWLTCWRWTGASGRPLCSQSLHRTHQSTRTESSAPCMGQRGEESADRDTTCTSVQATMRFPGTCIISCSPSTRCTISASLFQDLVHGLKPSTAHARYPVCQILLTKLQVRPRLAGIADIEGVPCVVLTEAGWRRHLRKEHQVGLESATSSDGQCLASTS